MSDSAHEELDRHAQEARERLMAKLDVIEHRTRHVVENAAQITRATAIGLAGAMVLSFALIVAQRASRSVRRKRYGRSGNGSLIADALRVGAVAVMFVGLSAWAKRAAQPHRASPPQLGQNASPVAGRPITDESVAHVHAGTTHALHSSDTVPKTQSD